MLNLVQKRAASVGLLYGKRAVQRVEVGASKKQLELPVAAVDEIYSKIDETRSYHNEDYNPMKWSDFAKLKLDAAHLTEAAEAGEKAAGSSLTDLDWYPTITALYTGQRVLAEKTALEKAGEKQKMKFLIQGRDL